ncbi:MAG TPA: ATP-binding protein [Candidatus Paceibacterota bacterium]|nr:ATP-binding protein [Candidatus Paceibacterota bacterium]
MFANAPLLIADISYTFFFLVTTIFGILVYLKSSRKTSHVMFLLLCLAVGIYQVSYVIGTATPEGDAARAIFSLSLSIIFVVAFTIHWIAATIEREKEYFRTIVAFYAAGIALLVTYLLYPASYLLDSVPKLYFPSYYQAGHLFWLLVVYFAAGFSVVIRMLFKAYRMADAAHKNRLSYYIAAILIGFPLGATSFLLAYDIPFDPIYSIPFNFFIAPLAYGTLRYDIMNIRVAARKALAYALFVFGTALFIVSAYAGQGALTAAYPALPSWIAPLASALVIVLFAGYVWERMRDLEILKYEFITVVTHKFRTPLTRIKWAAEALRKKIQDESIGEIESANENLVALTDMLVSLRNTNESTYYYEFEVVDIAELIQSVLANVKQRIADKNISLALDCPPKTFFASADKRRMLFALQIIVDNAITYTPASGKVSIAASHDNSDIYLNVADSGIGIAKDDVSKLFNKFWRSKEAKAADTEGMGIGLFMAKEIFERHDGAIYVSSEGVGKGATFTIRLPLVRE